MVVVVVVLVVLVVVEQSSSRPPSCDGCMEPFPAFPSQDTTAALWPPAKGDSSSISTFTTTITITTTLCSQLCGAFSGKGGWLPKCHVQTRSKKCGTAHSPVGASLQSSLARGGHV